MNDFSLVCPRCASEGIERKLECSADQASCSVCHHTWKQRDGIICFSEDIYWGEMDESQMNQYLNDIKTLGFDKAREKLQLEEPDRFRFFFDPARADWRFGIEIKPTNRVLDVGCGMGGNTFGLCDLVQEVVAFDLSWARAKFVQLRAVHEHKTNIKLFVGDFFSAPLPKGQFDVIVFNGILEWVGQNPLYDDPYKVQQWVMKRCFELLRPGGRMYVGIENRFSFTYLFGNVDHIGLSWTSWMPRFIARAYCRLRIQKDYRTYTHGKPGYVKLFREAGFSDIKVYMPYPGYNDQRQLIPFENIGCLKYSINSLMGSFSWKKRLVKWLSFIPGVLWIYRYFFFSYDIFGIKPGPDSHV